ncbi:hypothetical protein BKI52_34910 [marine bacterium AO1-C]|nr:hypothetical protein BKI52_34910 [marine bacterium AO1-C]
MFGHNFRLFIRSSLRYKGSFLTNLIGLACGLATAMIIYLWVSSELGVDKFHKNDRQFYQVMTNFQKNDGSIETFDDAPGPLAQALLANYPEVANATTVVPPRWFWAYSSGGIATHNQKAFKANGQYVSESFFDVFSYKVLRGNPKRILRDKKSVMISDELATKIFGRQANAINQTIEWDYGDLSGKFVIKGVFAKPPKNSTTQFDLIFSYNKFLETFPNTKDWRNSNPYTYVVLKKGSDVAQFNQKIAGLVKSHAPKSKSTLFVQRYSDKYLYGRYVNGQIAGGRIDYVRLFSIVAFFILLISCINFMNLATAKASRRIKEIGVKKALGAHRSTLVGQYLSEAMLMTIVAGLVAILIISLVLPTFNAFTQKQIELGPDPQFILGGLVIILFTGLLAGSYPALYLSGFKPVAIFKGQVKNSKGANWTRKGLVVFQFTLSVILVVSVMVVYQQIQLVQNKNLGYQRDQIISFTKDGNVRGKTGVFMDQLRQVAGVEAVSSMYGSLLGNFGSTSAIEWKGMQQKTSVANQQVGFDYIKTVGMKLIAGRDFSKKYPVDAKRTQVILNESAVKLMRLKGNPVGQKIKLWRRPADVVGVVKDFHYESLYKAVQPCFLRLSPEGNTIMVKLKAGNEQTALNQIKNLYEEWNQGLTFEYQYLDQSYQKLYNAENKAATLSQVFAGIAILISCLGLFGLAAFSAERRTKEIGIRKVLGSSKWNIVLLLSRDFTKMVLAAISLALPIGYFMAREWLNNFAYRVDLEWWYFALSGVLALFVAWVTISVQTLKTANLNPIESLRDE